MNPTTTRRSARLAALALCPVAVAATTTPVWADEPGGASPTAARASTLVSKSLSARTVLTSTTGKKLVLTVSASGTSQGSNVTIGLGQGNETHLWSFRARAADLAISSTGGGTLTLSNTQTGNRGRLSLKLSPKDTMRTRTCGGQVASKSRPVAVSGIAFFKTGTTQWGNVGRATTAISLAGTNTVAWSYDATCSTPPPACATSLSWSSFRSTATSTEGVSGTRSGTSSTLTAFRSLNLAAPAGASRMDLVTVRSAPVPTFSQTDTTATLTATNGTGSVRVDGEGAFSSSSPCRDGSTTRSSTTTQWFGTATNGTTAFRIGAQVFGAFTVPSGSTASISRQTF